MNKDINYWIARCASLEQELDIMKEQSTIKWQTEFPDIEGEYLVADDNGDVTTDCWCVLEHYQYWAQHRDNEVVAWCKLRDIKPFKEETTNKELW